MTINGDAAFIRITAAVAWASGLWAVGSCDVMRVMNGKAKKDTKSKEHLLLAVMASNLIAMASNLVAMGKLVGGLA